MLALEDAFDVEFPDAMLKRSVFQSVASITEALRVAAARRRHEHRHRPRPGVPRRDPPDRRRGRGARTPTTSTAQARFPVEAFDRAARGAGALCAHPRGARRRRRLVRGDRERLLRARPPLRRDRHGLRDAPDPDRMHRPPPRRRAVVRGLPPGRRERAATRRVGHVRGRHRRRPRPLDRRGHPGEATAAPRSRSRPRPSRTAPMPTTSSRRSAARPTPSPATRSSR